MSRPYEALARRIADELTNYLGIGRDRLDELQVARDPVNPRLFAVRLTTSGWGTTGERLDHFLVWTDKRGSVLSDDTEEVEFTQWPPTSGGRVQEVIHTLTPRRVKPLTSAEVEFLAFLGD